mmetsp:Transcript_9383/g.21844  ORF Transcript_9383/g.21844 Transcript_9383/m.21844 type:complete len:216 (-) Transcript_9383:250-897(-)
MATVRFHSFSRFASASRPFSGFILRISRTRLLSKAMSSKSPSSAAACIDSAIVSSSNLLELARSAASSAGSFSSCRSASCRLSIDDFSCCFAFSICIESWRVAASTCRSEAAVTSRALSPAAASSTRSSSCRSRSSLLRSMMLSALLSADALPDAAGTLLSPGSSGASGAAGLIACTRCTCSHTRWNASASSGGRSRKLGSGAANDAPFFRAPRS